MKNIEVYIVTVLREYKELTQFVLNKKVREKYNYNKEEIDKAINNLITDRVIIPSDEYNMKKYGGHVIKSGAEVKLFLNPECEFDKI
jgi:hypothetical protein